MASRTIENVWKAYGDYIALRDVNLDITGGEFVVLVGPSGRGRCRRAVADRTAFGA